MLRRGADQIKVMANGGCVSPTDELTSIQFTVAELRAAVEEAAAQGKYVMAHTYTAASMTNCLDADDTRYAVEALRAIGFTVEGTFKEGVTIGPRRSMSANEVPIFVPQGNKTARQ